MSDSRTKELVDRLINGIVKNELMPESLRSSITRKQVSEYLGISLIEASYVRGELALVAAKARLNALVG